MSAWAVALIWIGSILVYSITATVVGVKAYWVFRARTEANRSAREFERGFALDEIDRGFGSSIIGLIWPVAVWFVVAIWMIYRGEERHRQQAAMNADRDRMLALARKELEDL